MKTSTFHWPAILVSVVAGMFIGFLWYGLFFNAQWAEAVGLTGPGLVEEGKEVFKHGKAVVLDPVMPMIINAIAILIYGVIFSWLTAKTNMTSWVEGAKLGAIIACIPLIAQYVANLFAMEPKMLSMIDGSYYLALFTVIGAITGGWRKR